MHFATARRIVHDRVMLRTAVVPDRNTVRTPTPPHLILRDRHPADEICEQVRRTGQKVQPIPDVGGGMEVRECVMNPDDARLVVDGLGKWVVLKLTEPACKRCTRLLAQRGWELAGGDGNPPDVVIDAFALALSRYATHSMIHDARRRVDAVTESTSAILESVIRQALG